MANDYITIMHCILDKNRNYKLSELKQRNPKYGLHTCTFISHRQSINTFESPRGAFQISIIMHNTIHIFLV